MFVVCWGPGLLCVAVATLLEKQGCPLDHEEALAEAEMQWTARTEEMITPFGQFFPLPEARVGDKDK